MAAEQMEQDITNEAGTPAEDAQLLDEDFSLGFDETGDDEDPRQNIDLILDVGLNVVVELGKIRMKIRDILQLAPGSVIDLNRIAGEPVDVLVNDHPIAKGEVVLLDDVLGVRVTSIITPLQRIQSLR